MTASRRKRSFKQPEMRPREGLLLLLFGSTALRRQHAWPNFLMDQIPAPPIVLLTRHRTGRTILVRYGSNKNSPGFPSATQRSPM